MGIVLRGDNDIMIQDVNLLEELFLSTEMWGYFGPIGLVIVGYYLAKKDTFLTVLWFVVECLCASMYLDLVSVTPSYWWSVFILIIGGLFTCIFPMWGKHS